MFAEHGPYTHKITVQDRPNLAAQVLSKAGAFQAGTAVSGRLEWPPMPFAPALSATWSATTTGTVAVVRLVTTADGIPNPEQQITLHLTPHNGWQFEAEDGNRARKIYWDIPRCRWADRVGAGLVWPHSACGNVIGRLRRIDRLRRVLAGPRRYPRALRAKWEADLAELELWLLTLAASRLKRRAARRKNKGRHEGAP